MQGWQREIIVILAISMVAVVLTALGVVWSNQHCVRPDPDDEDIILVETPDTAWQAQLGTALGIGGATLGFLATTVGLFTEG